MKKLLLLILSLSMATVTFSSCSFLSGLFNPSSESSSPSSSIEAPSSEKEEKVYTVTFVQGGQTVKTIEVKEGEAVAEDDIPAPNAKVGYTVEWEKVDLSNITANVEVKAVETANTYTVTFDVDGGDAIDPMTVTFDSNVTLPQPTRDGYTFNYWLDATGKTVGNGKWTIADNITLKADWTEVQVNTYTITFKKADGSVWDRKVVEEGATLTDIPAFPTEVGYTYAWDVTDFRNITSNMDVTLIVTPKTYTITYDLNGGTLMSGDLTQTVTYNSEYALNKPEAEKEGYTFGGWQAPANMPTGEVWTLADDVTLSAIWNEEIPNVYTINFMSADGATVLYTRTVTEGEALTDIPVHTIAGYDCSWNVTDFSNITDHMEVKLIATPKTYTITFDPDGGTLVSGELTQTVTFNEPYSLNNPVVTKSGFDFDLWEAVSGSLPVDRWTITEDMTVKAKWIAKAIYTIKFVQNGQAPITFEVEAGQAFEETIPTPAPKTGYTVSWNEDDLAKLNDVQSSFNVNAVETPNTYTIIYSDEKGAFTGTISLTYDAAYNLAETVPTVTGYHFVNFTLADGTVVPTSGDAWTIAENVTITANWAPKTYTVVLNAGSNGTCSETQITVIYGEAYSLPAGTPNEGYSFEGWKLNGEVIPMTGTWTYTAAGTIELTASWQ